MPVVLGLNAIEHAPYISSSFTPPRHQHSHEFFELTFCVSGHSINTINNVPFSFQNGCCVILRPKDVHSLTEYDPLVYEHVDLYATVDKFKTICDACNVDLYREITQTNEPICFPLPNAILTVLMTQSLVLKDMLLNKTPFLETVHSAMITTILSEWIKYRAYTKTFIPAWINELLPKFNDVNFVQKNITQIAQESGFSLPYFSTQFKKYIGMTAIEYLTKKRVHISKDLLTRDSRLRILDISGMLGFENPSTFSKHFMQEFKMTPKEYRKLTQNHTIYSES